MLAYLTRRAPRPVSRDELSCLFWGDREETKSRQSLRHALHQIRRALGDAVEVTGEAVRIRDGAIELDANQLEDEANQRRFSDAVERWGGEFLPNVDDSGGEAFRLWLEQEREGLRRTVNAAFAKLIQAARAQNQPEEEQAWSRRWAAAFPLSCEAHQALIESMIRGDNIDHACDTLVAFTARLRSELDLPLSPELVRLHEGLERRQRQAVTRRPGSGALLTPDVVGRDGQLSSLLQLWERVQFESSVVLVEGEEGIGKTRFCIEFTRRVRQAGKAIVLDGSAAAGDQETPWATLRRALSPSLETSAIQNASHRAISDLAAVLPGLRERFPHLRAATNDAARLTSAVQEVVNVISEKMPVLLVIDDFASADVHSQAIILAFVRDLPRNTLVVLTVRTEDLSRTSLVQQLGHLSAARRVKLPPLTPPEVSALIDSMLEMAPRERDLLAERVVAETGGNPFFLIELISSLADDGALRITSDGMWQITPDLATRALPLPPSLRATLKQRLALLDARAQVVVGALAAMETPAPAPVIHEASELSREEFDRAMDELLSRRILRESARGAFEFRHELIRRVAVDGTDRDAHQARASTATPRIVRRRSRTLSYAMAAVLGIGVVATMVSVARRADGKPLVATDELRVVVASFANETGDAEFDPLTGISADWLTRGIARTGVIAASPPARIEHRERRDQETVTELRRVAASFSANLIVTGSIRRSGDSLRFSAWITSADRGTVIGAVDPVMTSVSRPTAGLETLRQKVLATLSPRADVRLASSAPVQSTPPSYEAYRTFAEGLEHFYARRGSTAIPLLLRTYELDTTFTLPLLYLAIAHDSRGDLALADSLIRTLKARRGLLAPYDGYLFDYQVARLAGDRITEFAAARNAATIAPGSFAAVLLAPRAAMAINRPSRTLEYLLSVDQERTAAAGLPAYWNNLAHVYHVLQRYQDQLAVARKVRRRLPTEDRALYYEARSLAALGRTRELEAVLDAALSWSTVPAFGPPGLGLHLVAAEELRAHGHDASARRMLERALNRYREVPESILALPRVRTGLADVLYQSGRLAEARAILEQLAVERPFGDVEMVPVMARIGYVAVLQGDDARADDIERFLTAPQKPYVYGLNTSHLARMAALRGRKDEAVRLLRKAMSEGWVFDHTVHHLYELQFLRGFAAFEEWLQPKG